MASTYDELPYDNLTHQATHPGHTAVVARLMGLQTPDIAHCRVLELGCAGGANLLPQALAHPESEFVGVDLSARQVEDGKRHVETLALQNVTLRQADILDIDESWGMFDYIICHGVFSWVPAKVQEHLLTLCQKLLNPQGLAMISYNTYPGWHLNQVVREMMMYHVKDHVGAENRVGQARALLDFLIKNAGGNQQDPYQTLLGRASETLRARSDSYIAHEYLETHNTPLYFHEFIERAQAAGMQYLGDSSFGSMLDTGLGEEATTILRRLDRIRKEQYLDFLKNRTFRMTLLCHQNIEIRNNLDPQVIREYAFSLTSRKHIVSQQGSGSEQLEVRIGNTQIKPTRPMTAGALSVLLAQWPRPVTFDTLYRKTLEHIGAKPDQGVEVAASTMAEDLIQLYIYGVVRINDHPAAVATEPSERPVAYALARAQAATEAHLSNLRNDMVAIDPVSRELLKSMDGTHDRTDLTRILGEILRSGKARTQINGQDVDPQKIDDRELKQIVDSVLERVTQSALLVGEE